MPVHVTEKECWHIIFDGELSIYQAQDYKSQLMDQLPALLKMKIDTVVIDLSKTENLDTAGIQLLVALKNWLEKQAVIVKDVIQGDHSAHMFGLLRLDFLNVKHGENDVEEERREA